MMIAAINWLYNHDVYLLNGATLGLSFFAEIEPILKTILLIVSIIYTIIKMVGGKGDKNIDKEIKDAFTDTKNK